MSLFILVRSLRLAFFFGLFCLRSANGWLRKPRGPCDKNANRSCWTLGWTSTKRLCSCLLMFDEYSAGESFRTGNIACWKSREHSFIFSSYTKTLLSLDALVVYNMQGIFLWKKTSNDALSPRLIETFQARYREGFDLISCWHGLFSINFLEGWYELLGRWAKAAKAQKKLDRAQQKARLLVEMPSCQLTCSKHRTCATCANNTVDFVRKP